MQKNHRMHNELLWMPGHKIVNLERGIRSLHRFKTGEDRRKRDDLPGCFVRAGYLLRRAPFFNVSRAQRGEQMPDFAVDVFRASNRAGDLGPPQFLAARAQSMHCHRHGIRGHL